MSEMTPAEIQTLSLDAMSLVKAAAQLDGETVDLMMQSYQDSGEMAKLAGNLVAQCVSLLWNYSIATGIPAEVIIESAIHAARNDNVA